MCVGLGSAPELLEELQNVLMIAPDKVELICRINPGDPTTEIHWYCSRFCCMFRELTHGGKYAIERTIEDDDTILSLTIAVSEETDSAIYRCVAVNKFDKVSTECHVVVLRTFHIS